MRFPRIGINPRVAIVAGVSSRGTATEMARPTAEMSTGFATDDKYHFPGFEYDMTYKKDHVVKSDSGTRYTLRIISARRFEGQEIVTGDIIAVDGKSLVPATYRTVRLVAQDGLTHVQPA